MMLIKGVGQRGDFKCWNSFAKDKIGWVKIVKDTIRVESGNFEHGDEELSNDGNDNQHSDHNNMVASRGSNQHPQMSDSGFRLTDLR